MIDAQTDLDNLDAEAYLDDMRRLEEGGASFMDVKKTDVKKVKRGPIIAALFAIIFFLAMMLVVGWATWLDPETPIGVIAIFMVIFLSMIIGVVIALKQRLKEIDGGELNEASKY